MALLFGSSSLSYRSSVVCTGYCGMYSNLWMNFDTVIMMKQGDAISWRCALYNFTEHIHRKLLSKLQIKGGQK